MQKLEIVNLSSDHKDMLTQFFTLINSPRYTVDFYPHPFDGTTAAKICEYNGHDHYLALVLNKKTIIGYFMLRGWDEGYEIPAIGLCVLDDYQGLGLGRVIMKYLEALAALNGATQVMLKVTRTNRVALSLYESEGFKFSRHSDNHLIGYKGLK